jgi:hypothetical protein
MKRKRGNSQSTGVEFGCFGERRRNMLRELARRKDSKVRVGRDTAEHAEPSSKTGLHDAGEQGVVGNIDSKPTAKMGRVRKK